MLLSIIFATDLVIIFLLWGARIEWALQSPWFMHSIWFFVLYAASSALLLWRAGGVRTKLFWGAVILHFFVTYGVALIAFPLGYGFDPLIHQATEKYIVAHGPIAPLQPFYIGQYAIIVALHFITRIPIELLDRFLLPLLATITLPAVAYYGLVHGYRMDRKQAALATLLIPIISLPALTFTVPYNLAVLYALWWIFLLHFPAARFFIAGSALVTHPLIGVPLLIASVIARRSHRLWRDPAAAGQSRLFFILCSLLIPIALFLLFALYRLSHGLPFFDFSHRSLFDLFLPPFAVLYVPWHLLLLYGATTLLSFTVIGFGLWWALFRGDRTSGGILLGMSGGFFISSIVLYFTTNLPGIAANEQVEFARRLLQLVPIFFLPPLLQGVVRFFLRWQKQLQYALCCVGGGVLLALNFYMTYPQVNIAKPRAGWNVAAHDIAAVRAIDDDVKGEPYVVLSDRLLAAVAVREFGFEHAERYALDREELLFLYSEKMLKGEFDRFDLDQLRRDTGVQRIYLAVHEYWHNVDEVARTFVEEEALSITTPFGVRVFVFD